MSYSKGEVRKLLRERLNLLPREKAVEQEKNIGALLNKLFLYLLHSHSQTIPQNFLLGGYAPMEREVPWPSFLNKNDKRRMCFPALQGLKMKFYQCSLDELIVHKAFGVSLKIPPQQVKEVVPHLLLIPGLGFSLKGERMGRGKGFYDRYLTDYKGVKIGLAYREQLLEDIPTESHDISMDFVVSSHGVFNKGMALSLSPS